MRLPFWARLLCVKAYLRYLRWSGRTIVLGPWRSELGFEVLYFLPFLHWALKYAGIPKERCCAVSRGGMGVFYPAEDYTDLYELRSVDDLRLANEIEYEKSKMMKQMKAVALDRALVREAVQKLYGRRRYVTLHPSWMYWLFESVWMERDGWGKARTFLRFEPLPVPDLPNGFTLPEKFIAVRFYERATFPFHPGVKDMARDLTRALASHVPVVLLNQRLCADDHLDLPLSGENILSLPDIPPHQNFILQAAVLARAQAFVGTYGGVAQWALRYQKPSVSFYTEFGGTLQAHRTMSAHLSNWLKVPFEVSCLGAIKLWGMTLLRVTNGADAQGETAA